MINPTGKKLQDLVSKMIDDEIEGVDKYTLNGSTWLIFTDQKRWVIEYTEDNILWYNYSFFTEIFDILSMKSTESQNLIQEWFESRFLRPTVNETRHYRHNEKSMVEHTIQNGVRHNGDLWQQDSMKVEHTIQNGVKHTDFPFGLGDENAVEDAIQNGVKETSFVNPYFNQNVEETIQNGVKHTFSSAVESWVLVEDTIQNGVKTKAALESHEGFMKGTPWVDKFFSKEDVEDTIQNGVKRPLRAGGSLSKAVEDVIQEGVKHTEIGWAQDNGVEDVVKNGVKRTSGYRRNEKRIVEDTIQNGVKQTLADEFDSLIVVEDTIQKGVKETKPSTAASWTEVDNTIENGVRETNSYLGARPNVINTIQNGVKETHRQKFNLDGLVDDIIDNGVKETKPMDEWVNSHNIISDVMDYGNIEMVGTGHATDNEMNDVIENGVKEVRTDDGYVNHFRQNYKFNNVFEDIVKEVQSDCSNNTERVNGVIRVGEKLN